MSIDLVTPVQQLYAAFSRGDAGAIIALLAADVEWGEPDNPFNPAGGTRRGPEGVLEWLKIGHEAEIIEALAPTRFLADATSVAVFGHMRCRARQTQKDLRRRRSLRP